LHVSASPNGADHVILIEQGRGGMKHNPGFLKLVDAARARIKQCTVAEAKSRLERERGVHFVDVREDHEYAKDHARGARHIGKGIIERDIETVIPDKEAPIILYCGGGYRSALAADALQQMGYTNVCSMDGGIKAWRVAGYPMEQ
jgi:rhodanese-related sulfurtransferase